MRSDQLKCDNWSQVVSFSAKLEQYLLKLSHWCPCPQSTSRNRAINHGPHCHSLRVSMNDVTSGKVTCYACGKQRWHICTQQSVGSIVLISIGGFLEMPSGCTPPERALGEVQVQATSSSSGKAQAIFSEPTMTEGFVKDFPSASRRDFSQLRRKSLASDSGASTNPILSALPPDGTTNASASTGITSGTSYPFQ